jgi:hypothetical protein
MSESMIAAGDWDTVAAEYVLGTLEADERSAAKSLLAEDEGFAGKVKVWERRLGELHLMVEPVEPEPDIWQRIKAKLPVEPDPVIALPQIEPELGPKVEPEVEPKVEPAVLADAGLEASTEVLAEAEPAPTSEPSSLQPERTLDPPPELKPSHVAEAPTIAAETIPEAGAAPVPGPEAPADQEAAFLSLEASLRRLANESSAEAISRPTIETRLTPAEPTAAPAPAVSAVPSAQSAPAAAQPDQKLLVVRRRLVRWRAVAGFLLLAILAGAALPALWKYVPERVPPALRPLALMRLIGVTIDTSSALRVPAPPESQFDE